MNSTNLIGRLVRDPELVKTEDGVSICNFRLAVDDTFSKEDRADFLNVTVFGNQAEVCKKYLAKGLICGVQGRLRTETYTDKEGVKRYPTKIVAERVQFLSFPERTSARANENRENMDAR